jgi:hypothetical protein
MKRFVEGTDRHQSTLFPECLKDWICEDNPVRMIDVFVDELDLADLRFLVFHLSRKEANERRGAVVIAFGKYIAMSANCRISGHEHACLRRGGVRKEECPCLH